MNIFVLDEDPALCALYHNDKHVVKMILEIVQMLCTVQRCFGNADRRLYRATHEHHPCVKWIMESKKNYEWVVSLLIQLEIQFEERTGNRHRSFVELFPLIKYPPVELPDLIRTEFIQVVPSDCKRKDSVIAYRAYYRKYKTRFSRWTEPASRPWWL